MNEVTIFLYMAMVAVLVLAGFIFYMAWLMDNMRNCEHKYKHYRICTQCGHRQVEDK